MSMNATHQRRCDWLHSVDLCTYFWNPGSLHKRFLLQYFNLTTETVENGGTMRCPARGTQPFVSSVLRSQIVPFRFRFVPICFRFVSNILFLRFHFSVSSSCRFLLPDIPVSCMPILFPQLSFLLLPSPLSVSFAIAFCLFPFAFHPFPSLLPLCTFLCLDLLYAKCTSRKPNDNDDIVRKTSWCQIPGRSP